jgi:hypothetical protein
MSRNKISKKTKASTLLLLAFVSGVAGFYLLNKDDGDVLSWQDSNWLYRKSITVSNSQGSILTNEDVLVEVDTASMITAGKLQADCDDLRFYDSDDSTSLSYWVEGGCNTTNTQVWVQIPSLPIAGSTIYMYYGNDTAINAELSWTGSFILPSTSLSCATGWTRFSDLDNRFPLGSDTAGTTGGGGTHNHGQAICTSTTNINIAKAQNVTPKNYEIATNHYHTGLKVDINNASEQLPPYQTAYYCSSTDLNLASTLPMFFQTTPGGSWTQFNTWDTNFIYGGTTYATGGALTHTHTTTGGYTTAYATGTTIERKAHDTLSQGSHPSHYHTSQSGATGTGSNLPVYLEYPLYTTTSSYATSSPMAMSTAMPPLGWTRITALDNKYIRIASSYNGTTQGSSSHTHSVTITTGTPSRLSKVDLQASGDASGFQHSHSCTTTTASSSYQAPYYSVIYSQRKDSTLSVTVTVNEEEVDNNNPNTPTSLLTEGETNPIEITDTTPEFTAIFSDTDTTDTANYYQIQVNTSSDFTGTTMWDSTKTAFPTPISNNSATSEISYAGTTLAYGTTYYWRIKLWDNADGESSWSVYATFTLYGKPDTPTGLLTAGETNPILLPNPYPYFSAIYSDSDSQDSSAYEIEINTQSDFLGTVMWDTDKTAITIASGNRSSNIQYEGTPLSNTKNTLYWRIRFWDLDDYVSDWSATATFVDFYPSLMFEGLNLEGVSLN